MKLSLAGVRESLEHMKGTNPVLSDFVSDMKLGPIFSYGTKYKKCHYVTYRNGLVLLGFRICSWYDPDDGESFILKLEFFRFGNDIDSKVIGEIPVIKTPVRVFHRSNEISVFNDLVLYFLYKKSDLNVIFEFSRKFNMNLLDTNGQEYDKLSKLSFLLDDSIVVVSKILV